MRKFVGSGRGLATAGSVGVVLALGALAAGCGSKSSGGGAALAPSSTSAGATSGGSTSPGATTPAPTPGPVPITPTPAPTGQVVAQGTLRVLTYNVAGLPQAISGSSPATNTTQISPLLNTYELVLVQEDFTYHTDLASQALHTYQSLPQAAFTRFMNDGLNRFSASPFTDHQRVTWGSCNGLWSSGSDCLADKGFSVARHDLAPGVTVDVYNLHADASGDAADIAARVQQFAQLATFIAGYSAGNALIVAGDTNLKQRDGTTLDDFLGTTGLTDSARALGGPEDIDRVMFRSTANIVLTPTRWREATEFVDATTGADLSDHEANNVDFEWKLIR